MTGLPISDGATVVLIADDDDMVREFLAFALRQAGYGTVEARDGREAVERFAAEKDRVSVVALDVLMPRLDGPATWRLIRAIRPDVGVVFMSGYAPDGVEEALAGEGVRLFLHKPFPPSRLIDAVRAESAWRERPAG